MSNATLVVTRPLGATFGLGWAGWACRDPTRRSAASPTATAERASDVSMFLRTEAVRLDQGRKSRVIKMTRHAWPSQRSRPATRCP
jgi:hypothetical protein